MNAHIQWDRFLTHPMKQLLSATVTVVRMIMVIRLTTLENRALVVQDDRALPLLENDKIGFHV